MPTGLTVIAYSAAVGILIAAVVAVVVGFKLWKTAEAVNALVASAEEDLIPLLAESRAAVRNVNALTAQVKDKTDRVSRLFPALEQILGGLAVASMASKAVRSSSVTVTGVLEGLKFGLKALRGASNQSKEESVDE